jgi:hypothetical protein
MSCGIRRFAWPSPTDAGVRPKYANPTFRFPSEALKAAVGRDKD